MQPSAYDRLIQALEQHGCKRGQRNGSGGYLWQCPAHDDRTPSLSVTNGNGRVLLYCHTGCHYKAILEALHLEETDMFDDGVPRDDMPVSSRWRARRILDGSL